jgi:hypothetical protein
MSCAIWSNPADSLCGVYAKGTERTAYGTQNDDCPDWLGSGSPLDD